MASPGPGGICLAGWQCSLRNGWRGFTAVARHAGARSDTAGEASVPAVPGNPRMNWRGGGPRKTVSGQTSCCSSDASMRGTTWAGWHSYLH